MRKWKLCPKCYKRPANSRHHIFPRRYWGKGRQNNYIIMFCRLCHDSIELLIPFRKMPKEFYVKIVREFMGVKNEKDIQNMY